MSLRADLTLLRASREALDLCHLYLHNVDPNLARAEPTHHVAAIQQTLSAALRLYEHADESGTIATDTRLDTGATHHGD